MLLPFSELDDGGLVRSQLCEDDFLRINIVFAAVLGREPVKIHFLIIAGAVVPRAGSQFDVMRPGIERLVIDERSDFFSCFVKNFQCYAGFVGQVEGDSRRTEWVGIGQPGSELRRHGTKLKEGLPAAQSWNP